MSDDGTLTIHTDGASRGNPGPSAYAYVIEREGADPVEVSRRLPDTTNNVAEYTALLEALRHARTLGGRKLRVFTDSELMVKQLQGAYKVKNEGLRPLYEEVMGLWGDFESVLVRHVPREQNKRADRLCNETLDAGRKPAPAALKAPKSPSRPASRHATADEQAVECLRSVAAAWARGNPNDPPPELVWEQLWNILEENGIVR